MTTEDEKREARQQIISAVGLSVLNWAKERLANSERIAKTKTGDDFASWLEDVAYWQAIVESLESLQWRPIETAPKDGTEVLVSDGKYVWAANYLSVEAPDEAWLEVNVDPTDVHGIPLIGLTHWQPLPDPPTQEPTK